MKSFHDKSGTAWIIEINVRQIRTVRALLNVDLANLITFNEKGQPETDLLDKISNDPCLLVDIIFALCKDQAESKNIDSEKFAENIDGDTIEAATVALLEEMTDFFPEAKRRVLRVILDYAQKQARQAAETLTRIVESPEFQQNLENQLTKSSSTAAGSSD